jgi:hypothetical protein
MKYTVFQDTNTGVKYPVIFPDCVAHSQVVVEGLRAVSAGFVNPKTGECFDGSESLKADPSDSRLISAVLTNDIVMLDAINEEYRNLQTPPTGKGFWDSEGTYGLS